MNTFATAAIATLSLAALATAGPAFAGASDSEWVNPVIKEYGRIHPLPHAALQPQKGTTYKVVFDVKGGKDTDGVNGGLWHVARAVNVFGEAGVDKAHRKFAVVIHGPATPVILSAKAYKAKMGKDNPNLKLIHALTVAGVKIYVCGQAAADNKIAAKDINPDVTLTVSALADLPILE